MTSLHPQGGCATFLCQPLDVLKTRLMNAKGEYKVGAGPGAGGRAGGCRGALSYTAPSCESDGLQVNG